MRPVRCFVLPIANFFIRIPAIASHESACLPDLWENAVDGNTGGTSTFVDGPYNPTLDSSLGTYGVNTTNDVVWAVIDHNSTFTVDTQTVPEPGGPALLACALFGLLALGRFRRQEAVK
jgi:MYXO-CTERM domain-containing protein